MNEKAFLSALEQGLRGLPSEEVREILVDYQEYFRDAAEAGRSEDEVVASLGDPAKLAKELRAQVRYRQWEENKSFRSLFRVMVAVAGLGLVNFLLAIPFMVYLSLLTAGWVTAVTFFGIGLFLLCIGAAHGLTGWPELGVNHRWIQEGTITFSAAEDGQETSLGDDFDPSEEDMTVSLRKGDSVILHYRNGEVVSLTGGENGLKIDSSGPTTLKADADKEVTLPKKQIKSYLLKGEEGGSIEMTLGDASGDADIAVTSNKGDRFDAKLKHGEWPEMSLVQPEHQAQRAAASDAFAAVLGEQVASKAISSDAAQRILEATGNAAGHERNMVIVSGFKGLSLLKVVLLTGVGLLLSGLVGVVFLLWLTRWTWRGIVALVKAQIALLSPRNET